MSLAETAEGTALTYSAKAQIGGKLAQVGSRLIDGVARKMSDDFFKAFCLQLSPAALREPSPTPTPTPKRGEALDQAQLKNTAAMSAPSGSHVQADALADAGSVSHQPPGAGPVMVPGWWLAVAAVLGAGAVVSGALLIH